MALHIPASPSPTPSTAAHIQSISAHSLSLPDHTPSTGAHTLSSAAHISSKPAHFPSMPDQTPYDVGLDAPASPLQIPMHIPFITPSTENPRSIDGKSTFHRRSLSPPSTPLLYGPKHLATPTPHSHHRLTVSPISFFSFSFAFCPINFPFAPGHQQPYPQPYSLTHHLVQ